jgi:hypothetical protein
MENAQSPLQKYKRQPKLYIDLPSKGVWYNNQDVASAENLEVYSMSASDEILIKTPDALITGNATVKIIQNCIPAIKNAWAITNRDFDYIMAAIRIASYGDSLTISHKCSSCNNDDTFALPLQGVLDHLSVADLNYEVQINGFTLRLRPLLYKEVIENQQVSMRIRRGLANIIKSSIKEEDKEPQLNSLYDEINKQTEDTVCSVVTEVTTPDGDKETNPVFIKDFLLNNESIYFNAVQEAYTKNSSKLAIPQSEVTCSECSTKDKISPVLDYSSFFSRA